MNSLVNKPTSREKIWHIVNSIPDGKVSTYGRVADLAGLPGRARYVGYCLRNCPSNIQLDWHKVLKSNGHLAFTKGTEMANRQRDLLLSDGVTVVNNKVTIASFLWVPSLPELIFTFDY